MPTSIRRMFIQPLVLAMVASAPLVAQNAKTLEVGQFMPDAEVVELNGSSVHLQCLVGKKPVLIEFWATWCGVCKALKPRLDAAKEKYGDRVDFIVLAVSQSQTLAEVSEYLSANGLPGRPLYDSKGTAMAAFGVAGTGYIFVVDRNGRVTYAGVGPNQDIEAAIGRVLTLTGSSE